MKIPVVTGLPEGGSPIEWATMAEGVLYTAQIPIHADGTIESGSMQDQARLTFANLRRTLEAAGGSLDDVTQVLVFLTDKHGFAEMNKVFEEFFRTPFPNRATTIVAGLMVPGARIEIVAYAHLSQPCRAA